VGKWPTNRKGETLATDRTAPRERQRPTNQVNQTSKRMDRGNEAEEGDQKFYEKEEWKRKSTPETRDGQSHGKCKLTNNTTTSFRKLTRKGSKGTGAPKNTTGEKSGLDKHLTPRKQKRCELKPSRGQSNGHCHPRRHHRGFN